MKPQSLPPAASCAGAVLVAALLQAVAPAQAAQPPWRLGQAVSAPHRLSLSGSYRLRYETLDGAVRAGATGSDQVLESRLLLAAKARFDSFYVGGEFEDSRAFLADTGTPIGTDDVDTAELLQAYVGYERADVFQAGDELDLKGGRMTIDVGSRRLVARNRFRNTLNAFTGVQANWKSAGGTRVQAFYVLPVDRRPKTRAALDDETIANDVEGTDRRFWGVDIQQAKLFGQVSGEAYIFGLHETDSAHLATKNRRLTTPGFRLFKSPAKGAWDFELEGAYQFGKSRASTSATKDLDHSAGFVHFDVARTLNTAWSPRLVFDYDYASGDANPNDNEDNRFDTLYGARRFDFGPTGIYGPFSRANINSPGVRIQAKPSKRLRGFLGYRAIWLASSTDALGATGVRDTNGASGSFAGNQIEARVRYDLVPGNLRLEFGGAYLFDGEFLENAPNAAGQGNTSYAYSAVTFSF